MRDTPTGLCKSPFQIRHQLHVQPIPSAPSLMPPSTISAKNNASSPSTPTANSSPTFGPSSASGCRSSATSTGSTASTATCPSRRALSLRATPKVVTRLAWRVRRTEHFPVCHSPFPSSVIARRARCCAFSFIVCGIGFTDD